MADAVKPKTKRRVTKVEGDFSLKAYRTPHVYSVELAQELISEFKLEQHDDFYLEGCGGRFDVYLAEILQHHYLSYTGREFERPRTPDNNQARELYKNISLHAHELRSLIAKLHLNQRLAISTAKIFEEHRLDELNSQLSCLGDAAYGLELQVPTQKAGRKESVKSFNHLITELYRLYKQSTMRHSGGATTKFIKACLKPIKLPSTIGGTEVSLDGHIKEAMKEASKIYREHKGG